MDDGVFRGYDKVEHYESTVELEKDFQVNIQVFTVYGDAEGVLEDEFQMINYSFNRDVTRGLEIFRSRADEFTDYRFHPIIGDYRGPVEATVMINTDDRVKASNLAEELVQDVHEEIGL